MKKTKTYTEFMSAQIPPITLKPGLFIEYDEWFDTGFYVKIRNVRHCVICHRQINYGEICLTIYPFSYRDSGVYIESPGAFCLDCLKKEAISK